MGGNRGNSWRSVAHGSTPSLATGRVADAAEVNKAWARGRALVSAPPFPLLAPGHLGPLALPANTNATEASCSAHHETCVIRGKPKSTLGKGEG
jgi:hypothetical protein